MLNVIKSDIYRIFRGKAIYITIVLLFFFMILSCFELSPGYVGLNNSVITETDTMELTEEDQEEYLKIKSIMDMRKLLKKYPYKLDKAILGANANLYYIFIVIIVIVLATDFSNSTIKNSISSSISRKKYYLSKLTTCLLFCTGMILLNNYGTYFVNMMMNGSSFSSSLGEITKVTLYQLPLMYGIISLLICICALFRKTSIFNAATIPFLMVFQLIVSGIISLFRLNSNIMSYEYQVALTKLASNPTNVYILESLAIGFTYFVVFNIIGYITFKKAEIK